MRVRTAAVALASVLRCPADAWVERGPPTTRQRPLTPRPPWLQQHDVAPQRGRAPEPSATGRRSAATYSAAGGEVDERRRDKPMTAAPHLTLRDRRAALGFGVKRAAQLGFGLVVGAAVPPLHVGAAMWGIGSAAPFPVDVPVAGTTLPSGVVVYDYKLGSGNFPRYGQVLRIDWVGYGRTRADAPLVKFDSSLERNTPLVFKHGSGRLVPGLEDGVHEMRVGGERRVVIPKRLAYNPENPYGPVPPDASKRRALEKINKSMDGSGGLVFDVRLLEMYDDDADPGYYEDESFDDDTAAWLSDVQREFERTKGDLLGE